MTDVTEVVMLRAAVKQLRADKDALKARLEEAREALRTAIEMLRVAEAFEQAAGGELPPETQATLVAIEAVLKEERGAMSEATRYVCGKGAMKPHPGGNWVRASSYDALKARLENAVEALIGLQPFHRYPPADGLPCWCPTRGGRKNHTSLCQQTRAVLKGER